MRTRVKPPQILAPTRLSQRYFELDEPDVWLSVVFVTSIAMITMTIGFWWYGLVLTLTLVILLYRTNTTRVYRIPIDGIVNFNIKRKKHVMWDVASGAPPPVPFIVDEIIDDSVSMGLFRIKGTNDAYAVPIIGTGASTTTKNLMEQYRRSKEFAKRLEHLGAGLGISWVYRTSPANPWPTRTFIGSSINPYVFVPEGMVKDSAGNPVIEESNLTPQQRRHMTLHKLAGELQKIDETLPCEVTMALVLTTTGNQKLRRADTVSTRTLRRSPIMRDARRIVRDLREWGVMDAHIATGSEALSFFRSTWDSVGMAGYYDDVQSGVAGAIGSRRHLMAHRIEGYPDHLVVDGNFIGITRVTTQPEMLDPTSFLDGFSLLDDDGHPINGTFAKVGQAVNLRNESRFLGRIIALLRAATDLYMSGRYRTNEAINRDESLEARDRMLGELNYYLQNYNLIWVTVSPSLEAHRDAMVIVEEMMERKGLGPKPVKGAIQQWRALWSATGINLL
ncbi:MAG TPA: hypothetical protein PKV96_00045 [Candidatus Saccharimonas sp.]|jgi:hypothetical protein|nr:hypothetical protein [Candidatus Saccharimonas sp.]